MIGSIELYQDKDLGKYGYFISYYNEKGHTRIKFFELKQHEFYMLREATEKNKRFALPNLSWQGKEVVKGRPHPDNITHCRFGLLDYLNEMLGKDENKHILDVKNKPQVYACDIETAFDEVTKEFPKIDEASQRIISFAFTSPKLQTYAVGDKELSPEEIENIERRINKHFSTTKYSDTYYTFRYKYFKYDEKRGEVDMINHIAKDLWSKREMPLITGWNFLDFDWAYIYNRCRRLGINPAIFSPEKRMRRKKGYVKDFSGERIIAEYELPAHNQIHDYLRIFDKYDYTIKPKESLSLNWISEEVLGVKKIEYDGDLMDLYHQDYETYIFYNAVDTILVQLIHQAKQTLSSQISNMAALGIPLDDLYGTIKPTEKLLHDHFTKEGLLIPRHTNKPYKQDEADKRRASINYKGGLVLDPIGGRYFPKIPKKISNAIILSKDFAGLYPSIMESLNFSFEGFVETFLDMDLIKDDREKVVGIAQAKINEEHNDRLFKEARERAKMKYGDNPNFIISYRGAVYKNDKDYSLRTIQRNLKVSRDAHKALKNYLEGVMDTVKSEINRRQKVA